MRSSLKKFGYILTKKEKLNIVKLYFLMIIGGVLELIGVSFFFPLIQMIMKTGTTDLKSIIKLALVIIGIYFLKNLFLIYMYRSIFNFTYGGRKNLSQKMFETYMKEPYAFHLDRNPAVLQRAINSDVTGCYDALRCFLQMMSEIVICFGLTVLLIITDVKMALFLLVLVGSCMSVVYITTKKKVRKLGASDMEYSGKMLQWVSQGISGIKEIKLLGNESYFINEFGGHSEKSSKARSVQQLLMQVPRLLTETVCMTGILLLIIFYSLRGKDLIEFIPTLSVFAVAAFRLLPSVGKINGHLTEFQFNLPKVDFIYNDLTELRNDENGQNADRLNEKEISFNNKIEIVNLTFKYEKSNESVLEDVSFDINKNQSVGFIGATGAGKTTLIDIIIGVLEPTRGEILSDGVSIKNNIYNWYKKIGYVPQTIYLTDDSIRKNIALGINDSDIDDERIRIVLKQTQLEEFVDSLPDGIGTIVGDRGIRLSGGQRQRIGIARALYINPEILVLDEATSALDTDTEVAVMDAIDSLYGTVTMLIIAHRHSTLKKCDAVYEVHDGKVVKAELN